MRLRCLNFSSIVVYFESCRGLNRNGKSVYKTPSQILNYYYCNNNNNNDRLCGLVVRVSGYRYRSHGFDPRRYQIFWVVVDLERGPLSLVSLVRSIEELFEWKK